MRRLGCSQGVGAVDRGLWEDVLTEKETQQRHMGTLRLHLPMYVVQVWSLVGQLSSHMP